MARPASLSLVMPKSTSAISSTISSPSDIVSNPSSPRKAKTATDGAVNIPIKDQQNSFDDQPRSPEFTSLPPFPSSPVDVPGSARDHSRGFFSNLKASKSSNRVHHIEPTIRQVSDDSSQTQLDNGKNVNHSKPRKPDSAIDLESMINSDDATLEGDEGKHPMTECKTY